MRWPSRPRALWALVALVLALLSPGRASAKVLVLSGLDAAYDVAPGEVVRGKIELKNIGAKPWTGLVSLTDYRTEGDRKDFPPAGSNERSLATWITMEPPGLTLGPQEVGEIRYEIRVPDDASLRGSYWAMVMVEDLDAQEVIAAAAEPGKPGMKVSNKSRLGVRLTATLREGESTMVRFAQVTAARAEDGTARIDVDVHNTGNRWLRTTVRVEIYDAAGAKVGTYASKPWSLYPDNWIRFEVPAEGLAPGTYAALVIADGGPGAVFATRPTLTVP